MSGSCQGIIRVLSGSCHIRVMSGSCRGHVRVILGVISGLFQVMLGSCQGYDRVFQLGIISFVNYTRRLETEGFSVLFPLSVVTLNLLACIKFVVSRVIVLTSNPL